MVAMNDAKIDEPIDEAEEPEGPGSEDEDRDEDEDEPPTERVEGKARRRD
jgi:hypothetical protein